MNIKELMERETKLAIFQSVLLCLAVPRETDKEGLYDNMLTLLENWPEDGSCLRISFYVNTPGVKEMIEGIIYPGFEITVEDNPPGVRVNIRKID